MRQVPFTWCRVEERCTLRALALYFGTLDQLSNAEPPCIPRTVRTTNTMQSAMAAAADAEEEEGRQVPLFLDFLNNPSNPIAFTKADRTGPPAPKMVYGHHLSLVQRMAEWGEIASIGGTHTFRKEATAIKTMCSLSEGRVTDDDMHAIGRWNFSRSAHMMTYKPAVDTATAVKPSGYQGTDGVYFNPILEIVGESGHEESCIGGDDRKDQSQSARKKFKELGFDEKENALISWVHGIDPKEMLDDGREKWHPGTVFL